AALFSAGCEIAGIISGKYSREALKEFGKEVGLAFQIKDDLLDLMGNPKEMGKERGNDLKEGKITLPLLLLKEKGHRSKIEEVVLKDKISEKDIEEIVTLCLTERILEETENIIRGHLKNAKKHLEETGFEEEKKKDLLRIVKFLEERSY
ncbi:MAG: polyprenyl synthetase family protein, partial [candidate division WOR-3 bacterium]